MPFNLTVFLMGALGGALAELLKWFQLREAEVWPAYAKSTGYWIITVLMVLSGGLLASVYGLDPGKGLLAMNVGITAPLIIKGLAAAAPSAGGGTKDLNADRSIVDILAGR
jgi:hypothetical protein